MNFEGIKLLDHEPSVPDSEVDEYIEYLVQQGAGWGLRNSERLTLTLARVAASALDDSAKFDETHRALKGAQMENGRLKKQLRNAQDANTELAEVLDAATTEADHKDKTIESMEREIERLTAALDSARLVEDAKKEAITPNVPSSHE